MPWLCVGDFNEITYDAEKLGGALRPIRQMATFRQVLSNCNLHEVPVSGPKFTWFKGRGPNVIMERLDRGVANEAWLSRFPTVFEVHLVTPLSNHVPLLFHVSDQQEEQGPIKKISDLKICGLDMLNARRSLPKGGVR